MRNSILLLAFLFSSIWAYSHPIKLSTGKLEFDMDKQECQLKINFFIDDFEAAIRALYPQPPFDFSHPSQIMKSSIADYIQKNLTIEFKDQPILLSIDSISTIETNVCQVVLKGKYSILPKTKTISIINTLLFETYRKQSNILHVFINERQKDILQFYPSSAKKEVDLH